MSNKDDGDAIRILERLYEVISERKEADPDGSYTARLFDEGTGKIAQKLGEEAVETVIAALAGKKKDITGESADLLYHLFVLWADAGIEPGDVWAELARREGLSGLEEKKSRG